MATSLTNEFVPDTDLDEDLGPVIITDARLLLRPAPAGQKMPVAHDAKNVWNIFFHGDQGELGGTWHIATHFDPMSAHAKLDPVFRTYVDSYRRPEDDVCARVRYIGEFGEVVRIEEYGSETENCTMHFNVYTGYYWKAATQSFETTDWTMLLHELVPGSVNPIAACRVTARQIPDALRTVPGDQPIIVIFPDDTNNDGYVARGFRVALK